MDDLEGFLRSVNTCSLDLNVDIYEHDTIYMLAWIYNHRHFSPISTKQNLRYPKGCISKFGFVEAKRIKQTLTKKLG